MANAVAEAVDSFYGWFQLFENSTRRGQTQRYFGMDLGTREHKDFGDAPGTWMFNVFRMIHD
jgi:hypothetical protein